MENAMQYEQQIFKTKKLSVANFTMLCYAMAYNIIIRYSPEMKYYCIICIIFFGLCIFPFIAVNSIYSTIDLVII